MEETKLPENPAHELLQTQKLLELKPEPPPPPVVSDIPEGFDPEIHKVDERGVPMLGSKKQLLLKREAKKNMRRKIQDGVEHLFGKKEKDEFHPNDEKPEIPLSDHEIAEKQRVSDEEAVSEAVKIGGFSASAQVAAEATFLGYSALLGGSVYDHRAEFFPRVCQILQDEENRTGRAMPIPDWLITPIALVQVGGEIVQKDERCKQTATAKVAAIKKIIVQGEVRKSIFSRFQKPRKPESEELRVYDKSKESGVSDD